MGSLLSSPSPHQDKNKNTWLPTIVLALAATLNIPPAIIAISTHFVNQHPWWSLLMLLGFAIFDFTAYIIARLWQRLEGPWLDDIAHLIDYRIRGMFSGYWKHYYQYLGYQHRDFDVKGLSLQGPYTLELEQVFVELSIDSTTIQHISANPISIPQELREGSHTIWDYLASALFAKQHLVIIGPPGNGKTTLLKHITLTLLTHRTGSHTRSSIPRKLPILLFLRDHATAIHTNANKDKPDFTLIEALHDHLKRWEQPDPPPGWVKRQLDKGRCLILLDGLDEVADPQIRKEVVDWVEKQMAAYRENRFVITSRPFGIRDNPLRGVATLEALPFTPEKVERFVHKWYLANEIMSKQKDDEGVRMRARADARGLLQQLHNNPALLDLTANPLLLTMIAIIHRYGGGGKLPEKQVSLYADICKVFFGKRQEAKGQQLDLKPEQMQLVLESLAYHMMQEGVSDITPEQALPIIEEPLRLVNAQISVTEFLKLVENVSGLLLERENGYSFAHLTFQEYLAAIYLREKHLIDKLLAHVEDSWWRETIRLYCAMADATPIIEACLAGDPPSVPALVLAFDCQKEALKLQPEVKTRLETILSQGMEDANPQRQHIAAEVLLARRLRQMIYLKENAYIDTSMITCAEYQLFLDEQKDHGQYYQLDHWKDYRFPPGQGHAPIFGMRSSDAIAFCTWLTFREPGSWRYRLPASGELEQTGDESILNRFPNGAGYWLDKGFAWLKEPLTMPGNVIQVFREKAHTRAHGRVLAYARDRARALDLNIDYTLDLDRTFAFELALDHAIDRAIASGLTLNQSFDLTLDRARSLDLDRAFDLTLDLVLVYNTFFSEKKRFRQLDTLQRVTDNNLDIYITLAILEERTKGILPACEGILIVKERKQENA